MKHEIANTLKQLDQQINNPSALEIEKVKDEIQSRMSDHAGFICHRKGVKGALLAASKLCDEIDRRGLRLNLNRRIADYFQWNQMALTSKAVLIALDHYVKNGGGSRGARAICDLRGTVEPQARALDLSDYRYVEEQEEDRSKKIVLVFDCGEFEIKEIPLREMEDPGIIFFEKNWGNFLSEQTFKEGFKHK